jgi:hypothetical protein
MSEMADAKARHLEDEDRIAVLLHHCLGAEAITANIGGHVADQDIADGERTARRTIAVVPAAQHMGDARIGIERVVRRVRAVHRHDIGRLARSVGAAEIGGDGDVAGRLDDVGGMAGIGDGYLALFRRDRREIDEHGARQGLRHRKAFARRRLYLRETGQRRQTDADDRNDRRDDEPQMRHRRPRRMNSPTAG